MMYWVFSELFMLYRCASCSCVVVERRVNEEGELLVAKGRYENNKG